MILIDAYKLRNEIKKSDGYADSEYGKGICAGISRALQKLDEAEFFNLDKYEAEIRADERAKTIDELRSFIDKHYENIVFELKSGGKIEDANRVIDKFAEQMKEVRND